MILLKLIHNAPSFEELKKAISKARHESSQSNEIACYDLSYCLKHKMELKDEPYKGEGPIIVSGEFDVDEIENNAEDHE